MTDEEKALAVINTFLDGGWLQHALKQHGLTSTRFHKIKLQHGSVAKAYAQAREIKADLVADEVVAIADEEGDPQRNRLRVDTRKWVASVFNRPVYGDKLDMSVAGQVDLRAALAAHQAERLRLPSDMDTVADAEVIESQPVRLPQPTDRQSGAPTARRPPVNPLDD